MSDCVVMEIKEPEPDTATEADVEGKPNKISNLHCSNDEPV
ncbi:hypothetical protein Gotur_006343 [Gossypium turneri]